MEFLDVIIHGGRADSLIAEAVALDENGETIFNNNKQSK